MTFTPLMVMLLAAAIGGFAGGWKITAMYYTHVIDQRKAADEAQQESARLRERAAVGRYATASAEIRVRTIQVTREVENALQADSCARSPIDPGLRDAIASAESHLDQPVPDSSLWSPGPTPLGDVGRRGPVLRGSAGRTERLPSAPQGAGRGSLD